MVYGSDWQFFFDCMFAPANRQPTPWKKSWTHMTSRLLGSLLPARSGDVTLVSCCSFCKQPSCSRMGCMRHGVMSTLRTAFRD
jgi:hypothetical protein